ncbi:DUF5694 domain-containing protein [Deinococcus koreensis]|uniref:DUF5694 domain-containing protein n=1 Tax=Deinococcus koreensis TaxID=2054903 RepID=UPI0013FD3CC6|nr:DUF5694 domain-containing protein [Deinococcus koreensis]
MTTFTGPPTEVLIVGSLHLGADVPDAALARTSARLQAWRPDLVGVEVLPGELVELYDRQGGWLDELNYGGYPQARALGREAQEATGWTRAEAARQADDPALETGQRVMAHLAAFEPWNVLLHWTPDLPLTPPLAQGLSDLLRSPAESVRLGVAVARALGHSRLCLFDDFPVAEMTPEQERAFGAGVRAPEFQEWLNAHPFVRAQAQQRGESSEYWETLLLLNRPDTLVSNDSLEREANLRLGLPGRAKLADWEARNLFMAARLRMGTMTCPGGRVLAIVGHSHTGPMKAAVRALGADVRLVELSELVGVELEG